MYTKYWIRLKGTGLERFPLGIGVTAASKDDALDLVSRSLFAGGQVPEIGEFIEDVKIPDLDQNHVVPNCGNHFKRGVWFPMISSGW